MHTRVRELEVLKDRLLGFLADDATLQPRDIVVMAPDIAAYAPYLPSIFGRAAQYDSDPSHIPWHLADVALASTHPLFTGFANVLDLGASRFRVSDVMDLLDVPAVARRFGLDEAAMTRLEPWLRQSRVAWGLDERMKADAGAAPVRENTWSFAFDRLYAGFMAGDDTHAALIDGILPVQGVSGGDVDAIGRLDRLIESLRTIRNEFAIDRPLAEWSAWLLETIDALFAIDRRDDDEDNAMSKLRRTVAALGAQDASGDVEKLPWRIVRDVMRGALDTVSDRQPFLLGGVTFCGLVPQRSIPFRVVCLLGMNEGEYPRNASDGGLNRMQTHPRRGDRDTRNEDRYLFLEALMAARQALHISYIGEDVNDGSRRNPAAPLAELLEFVDEQTGATNDEQRTWLIRHPLQPFDRRYYTPDTRRPEQTRLFSFERAYEIDDSATTPRQPFVVHPLESMPADTADVTLKSLHVFWRNPSRATLRDGFGIGLDALADEALIDNEPLTPALERRERFETQLLDRAWRERVWELPSAPPAWLAHSGALPAGDIGSRAYARLRTRVQPMLDAMRQSLGDDAERISLPVDIDIGDARLVGLVDRVYRRADGTVHLLYTKPDGTADFRDLIPFYIDYAALRLSGIDIVPGFLECADKKGLRTPDVVAPILTQDEAQLRRGLSDLIRLPRDAARSPLFFFPKTSWCWTTAPDDKRDAEARKAWEGTGPRGKGERDYEPGYAALVARDSDFLRQTSPRHDDFAATNRWVASILDPHGAHLMRSGTRGDA